MDRQYYEEDSPWVEVRDISWTALTDRRVAKCFQKGHIFYSQREFCDNVFIIKHGRVAMCLCTPEGGKRIAVILNDECMFGNQTLFDEKPNSCQAQVISDDGALVYEIPKAFVKSMVKTAPDLVYNMLIQSNRINRMLLTQIEIMNFRSSESRVCFYLMHMAEQYSSEQGSKKYLQMRFTHQDIADASGLSRVCVSNVISNLIKENILTKRVGALMTVNMELLKGKLEEY